MTIGEMQQTVDAWISQFEEGYFSPAVMMLRLTEELGELAREVNHQFGPKQKKANEPENSLEMELGDILFVLASFANSLQIDLDAAFQAVMKKFETRDRDRWTRRETPTP
ncbi:nucleotide pyrophosphohydrolase [Sulfobacillus harzensis]|uniref:Nucleotide pyrophosphohydrolase n=1 Tax=Sulfobacillus harzensis TaxID=2729629 RepID=A0A7Y0Q298_9FIRM|nr:nucleotide pyrophosphohydrolase [Sulfobacillus harzensis]NMP20959.1 nucleotide pyrophosphohydrolase [Sulfobacillus harzensis]